MPSAENSLFRAVSVLQEQTEGKSEKNPGKGHVDKESSSTGMTTFPLSSMTSHSPSFDTLIKPFPSARHHHSHLAGHLYGGLP